MKNVLVTGGSRGIGYATALLLKERGYCVFTPSHSELDLSNLDSIDAFCKDVKDVDFHCLVNNAGINDIDLVEDIKETELINMMNINLIGPIRLIHHLVPRMKAMEYGRIVNIGSIWGGVGKPGRVVYAATKHGIHGVTKTLAVELAPYNILVNTICPGFTMTELTKKNNSNQEIRVISDMIPMKRLAEPIEQAKAIAFLLSDDNTYITGQEIFVDGGYVSQ